MVCKIFEVFNNHAKSFNITLDNWGTIICYWVNSTIYSLIDKICVFSEIL